MTYTPNQAGTWTVNFYWPGDDTYNALNATATFPVMATQIPQRSTWAYLSMNPYPAIGVEQPLIVNAWVTPAPESELMDYQGYTFTITAPNGTVTANIGPWDSEGEATVYFNYYFDAVGNWTINFKFAGDYFSLPCDVTRTITVQQAGVTIGYPDTPLPTTGPLTFPINIENRQWISIAGPWYQAYYNASQGAWNPYTTAPTTSHILWDLPAYAGIGGYLGDQGDIQNGAGNAAYGGIPLTGIYGASVYSFSVIMGGRGYSNSGGNITCIDIQSGKILWTRARIFQRR